MPFNKITIRLLTDDYERMAYKLPTPIYKVFNLKTIIKAFVCTYKINLIFKRKIIMKYEQIKVKGIAVVTDKELSKKLGIPKKKIREVKKDLAKMGLIKEYKDKIYLIKG